MASERDYKRIRLSKAAVIFLFVYYLTISITTFYLSVKIVIGTSFFAEKTLPLYLCLFMAAVGACIFYSRKLYKACIDDAYNFSTSTGTSFQSIGSFMFFLLRPIFALGLALCVFLAWKAALIASLSSPAEFSESHLYISGAIGFFVGFLAGRVIERLEDNGLHDLDRLTSSGQ